MFARFTFTAVLIYCVVAVGQPTTAGEGGSAQRDANLSAASGTPLVENTLSGLAAFGTLVRGISIPSAENTQPSTDDPVGIVWVRLTRDYLAEHLEREVDRERPARDEVLGITFVGTSRTVGRSRVVLHPSENGALAQIIFEGKIESRTTGRKGPATLHYRSDSTFHAQKPLMITSAGIETSPARAHAPTKLTPLGIDATLPGFRGRFVERVAWRRVAESQAKADAAASDHRADDIRLGLDRRLNERVAALQKHLRTELAAFGDGEQPITIKSRSTPDYLEIALLPPGCKGDQLEMPAFDVADDVDLAVRVHRSFVARAMSNPQLRDRITLLATGFLQTAAIDNGENATAATEQLANLLTGSEWFAYDVALPADNQPALNTMASDATMLPSQ